MKYVCELCGRIYDEALGDPNRGVPAGTAFAQLSEHYACPDCGSEKEAFNPANQKTAKIRPSETAYTKYTESYGQSQR